MNYDGFYPPLPQETVVASDCFAINGEFLQVSPKWVGKPVAAIYWPIWRKVSIPTAPEQLSSEQRIKEYRRNEAFSKLKDIRDKYPEFFAPEQPKETPMNTSETVSNNVLGGGHICKICGMPVINGQVCTHVGPPARKVTTLSTPPTFVPREKRVRNAADKLAAAARKIDPLLHPELTDALDEYDSLTGGGICG